MSQFLCVKTVKVTYKSSETTTPCEKQINQQKNLISTSIPHLKGKKHVLCPHTMQSAGQL